MYFIKNLEDILNYGKVVFGVDFDIRKLKKISRNIARNTPKKINPVHVDYFTLRPSGRSMFWAVKD